MAIRKILLYPHPLLKTPAQPVNNLDSEILDLIADLEETLDNAPGCVGIAAPQIGELRRVIVVDISRSKKATTSQGRLILINPRLIASAEVAIFREGCLSIPDYTANVSRASQIRVSAVNPAGKEVNLESAGWEAVALQHEIDHLEGILFLDRVVSLKRDVFLRKKYL